ncbi:MAG: nucleotidyltransferase domain-containing protein [bacterium]
MRQNQVIQRITELGQRILPEGASLWLYGSRARGDARPDSDYDLLILLDKDHLTRKDYDCVFDLRMLGMELNEEINPVVYPKKQWNAWSYTPFYYNVEEDKKILQ